MAILKLGPYELNGIYCGECSRMLAALPDGCIDLTVTSPPYDNLRLYNGYTFNFEPIARELYRVTKPGGVVVWVVGDETKDGSESGTSFRQALYFKDVCGFNLHDTMIYARENFAKPDPTRYWQAFEYTFVFSVGSPATINFINDRQNKSARRNTGKITKREMDNSLTYRKPATIKDQGKRLNIWHYNNGNGQGTKDKEAYNHPAIFPEALARDHILSWSNPGDIVLDPMVGSGTTAKMAYQLHRRYFGFDISQEYVDLARRRLAMADTPLPLPEAAEEKPEREQLEMHLESTD